MSLKRVAMIALVSVVIAVPGLIFFSKGQRLSPDSTNSTSVIRVAVPFTAFKSARIIDPSDTASTTEYYILENLGIGLLRDDPGDARSYVAGLANSWRQSSDLIWEFELAATSRWSDGKPIDLNQIAAHVTRLAQSESRHLSRLKILKSATVDEATRILRLEFKSKVDRGILHELSLADAVLTSAENRSGNWSVTSGPYSMAAFDLNQRQMVLSKNTYYAGHAGPATNGLPPDKVELFWPADGNIRELFTSHHADLFAPSAFTFKPEFSDLDRTAPRRHLGHATGNFLFGLDKRDSNAANPLVRNAFAAVVRLYFRGVQSLPKAWKYDDQVIPFGFAGRLEHFTPLPTDLTVLKGRKLTIIMYEALSALQEIFDGLALEARKHGAEISFKYAKVPFEEVSFARVIGFKGNQRDPVGSWSFLFSGSKNPISTFRSDYESDFAHLTSTTNEAFETSLARFHKKVLDDAVIVPFVLEETPVYTSARVDLSAWNQFDMRLRFYDIRIK